ncbi:MAG: helix-turn-helix domain-containing protein [Haloarculaceae archaeon]
MTETQRAIDGVTATMLSRRLKELECHGFVEKHVEPTTPPSTTYELTENGCAFVRLESHAPIRRPPQVT